MTDADIPLQPMTEYEQFLFDLKGFLVIPGVLSTAEIQTVRDHLDAYTQNPDGLPEPHRAPIAGPAEFLIDHPRAMGILQTVIDPDRERIRLESVFVSRRGIDEKEPWRPHGGGANVLPSFSYRYHNGRIYGGMTRIVWELNEVAPGDGATRFLSGSHKAAFTRPPSFDERDSTVWDDYSCPAGSCVVFTESLTHTGDTWSNEATDRLSLFTCCK